MPNYASIGRVIGGQTVGRPRGGGHMTQDQHQNQNAKSLKQDANHFHRWPVPGKIEVTPTKPLANQRDLALAYSPGVAAPCELIVEDPGEAANVTSRANLVGVITNGTAYWGWAQLAL